MNAWKTKPHADWDDMDLAECAAWWAGWLGLCSWDLTVQFKTHRELPATAKCFYNGAYETVDIWVRGWGDRDHADPRETDLERDIVHELVHARLWAFDHCQDSNTVAYQAHELAVERLAQALVGVRRTGASK